MRTGSSPRVRGTQKCLDRQPIQTRFIPAGAGNTIGAGLLAIVSAVHPRGRGEHAVCQCVLQGYYGSSPRARGTPNGHLSMCTPGRFIPAGAGNTRRRSRYCRHAPVHPRGRGEHDMNGTNRLLLPGSSPRARGTPARRQRPSDAPRFIPAGAGNTCKVRWSRRPLSVHPRGRGEHGQWDACAGSARGSSPRVRGTLQRLVVGRFAPRFIPAGAGNTVNADLGDVNGPVHPRGCGEHANCHIERPPLFGSSPRVRGTHTVLIDAESCKPAVHPRGRGEHLAPLLSLPISVGSSPRVRGTPMMPLLFASEMRFIPAGAGNTGSAASPRRRRSVHPRGRGEHTPYRLRVKVHIGSSPRARGTLMQNIIKKNIIRFIPAGAGNTLAACPMARSPAVHPRGCGEHPGS